MHGLRGGGGICRPTEERRNAHRSARGNASRGEGIDCGSTFPFLVILRRRGGDKKRTRMPPSRTFSIELCAVFQVKVENTESDITKGHDDKKREAEESTYWTRNQSL